MLPCYLRRNFQQQTHFCLSRTCLHLVTNGNTQLTVENQFGLLWYYHHPSQPFYGPSSVTIRVSRCQNRNFWTLRCKGRLTEANTPTIRLGATPSGLTSAHLHHPPFFTGRMPLLPPNQQCQSTEGRTRQIYHQQEPTSTCSNHSTW